MFLFVNRVDLYGIQWILISGVPLSAFGEKDSQFPFSSSLLLLICIVSIYKEEVVVYHS